MVTGQCETEYPRYAHYGRTVSNKSIEHHLSFPFRLNITNPIGLNTYLIDWL